MVVISNIFDSIDIMAERVGRVGGRLMLFSAYPGDSMDV
jgi:hypothetical protein